MSGLGPLEVLDVGVRAREYQGLVPGVAPPHAIWRPSVRADLQDLGISFGFADPMGTDDEAVSG
jgi:hypothetical protein